MTGTIIQDVRSLVGTIDSSSGAIKSINVSGLVPEAYDYIELAPAGDANPTSVTYKTGGASGTTVATLTLAYSGGELLSVTRS